MPGEPVPERSVGRLAALGAALAAVAVGAVALTLLLTAGDDEPAATTTVTAPAVGGQSIPAAEKRDFVAGCARGGATKSACECAIERIDDEYGYREFVDLSREARRTGSFPPEVERLIQGCRAR